MHLEFRLSGSGASLPAPLALSFEADSVEEACLRGLRVLEELPECERVAISGPGYVIDVRAQTAEPTDQIEPNPDR